jgi:hypothetical protein
MGSAKRSDSNREQRKTRSSRRARQRRAPVPTHNAPTRKPDIDAVIGHLSDAISIVATAANALLAAEESAGTVSRGDVGDEIITLRHGVCRLRRAYDELDAAVRTVRSPAGNARRRRKATPAHAPAGRRRTG